MRSSFPRGSSFPRLQLSPTQKRVIAISILLTLLAQIALITISSSYKNNMNEIVEDKRNQYILNQFHHNMILQFDEINRLLQLLQTPDFSRFFRGAMNVRDEQSVARQRADLLDRMNGLQLSPGMVTRIYFIGSDANQLSYVKDTKQTDFTELAHVRMDMLQDLGINRVFLKTNHQLVTYSENELSDVDDRVWQGISSESAGEIAAFASSLTDKLLITNGNMNGVLIIIELNPDYLSGGLQDERSAAYLYSNTTQDGPLLIWSSTSNLPTSNSSASDHAFTNEVCQACTHMEKDLLPYPYRILLQLAPGSDQTSGLLSATSFIWISVIAILVTLIISLVYTRAVFKPYYRLSMKMEKQSRHHDLNFRRIAHKQANRGIHALTLRTNLMLIFMMAIIVPIIPQGLLYANALHQAVTLQMKTSVVQMGQYAGHAVQLRLESMTGLINQLSISEQLRQYLIRRRIPNFNVDGMAEFHESPIQSTSYQGLNKVKYFVIFDENGRGVYSSIFSTDQEMFTMDRSERKDQEEPYWISGYTDIFHHAALAAGKRLQINLNGEVLQYYLLLVPGDALFQDLTSIETAIQLKDEHGGQLVNLASLENREHTMAWSGKVPNTPWELVFEYSSKEIMLMYKQYVYSFLFMIVLILVISNIASYVISAYLTKPLEQLYRTMTLVGEGRFASTPTSRRNNEIGEIIRSYNDMMLKLQAVISDNMRIMEESANNKVRENELLVMKDRAELQMLQAQINPHFLYNTLEAIQMRSLKNGDREISRMVVALAELFRYSISGGSGKAPLEKELDQVRNYISIQQMRYGSQFQFKMDVPESLYSFEVVKFILQPIIENSLKHGLTGFEEGGVISLAVRDEGEVISLVVSDNGIGMSAGKVAEINEVLRREPEQSLHGATPQRGIGLANVYHRLQLFYHEQATMQVSSSPMKGTEVTIRIPKQQAGKNILS